MPLSKAQPVSGKTESPKLDPSAKKRVIGLFLCRGWAQHIVDRWRDAVSPGSSPSASDDFDLLAISPLISFTAVLTAAIMCQVLKYLVLFPFISLCN